ncbi:MAG: cytochrome c biogenesis protein CcdA [Peptostreptococcus sp.]|uniref:redoxin family protein n=1 Tax=Peptostreptococcus sp. TaxID=1262 RepID=UPI002FC80F1A
MVAINSLGLASSISFVMVFLEGLVSFFSPCVIPLIPLYMGYLAGGAKVKKEDGSETYEKRTVILHTVFFVLGISAAFFILGLGFSSLGSAFREYRDVMAKLGGVLIIILGLNQIGLFKIKFLNKQVKISNKTSSKKMNPLVAFVMGFGFSFAWTPCVGPALASVLILASNASSVLEGNLLVFVYALGFLIPFIVLGIFTGQTLNFIKKNPKIMNVIVKVGGVILVAMGLMLLLGTFERFESLFNGDGSAQRVEESIEEAKKDSDKNKAITADDEKEKSQNEAQNSEQRESMIPIKLKDQNGNMVNVEDFKGKVVFINFFATWCPPCKEEIPDIENLYKDNGYNQNDVVVIGIAAPNQGREQDEEGVKNFIKEYNITYPVLMDTSGEIFNQYGAYSLPTTFLIDKESKVYGYVSGAIPRDTMDKAISDTKNLK